MQEFCDDENTKIYAVAFSVIKSFVLWIFLITKVTDLHEKRIMNSWNDQINWRLQKKSQNILFCYKLWKTYFKLYSQMCILTLIKFPRYNVW